jgi:hypothetical protein
MLVGERDYEPIEPVDLQLLAKGFEAVGVGGHALGSLTPSANPWLAAVKEAKLTKVTKSIEGPG